MSPLSVDFKTEYFADEYDFFNDTIGEPTMINVHHLKEQFLIDSMGNEIPYVDRTPVENVCIFSKEQAIRELLRLHDKYETDEFQPEEYDINLSLRYGQHISQPVTHLKR